MIVIVLYPMVWRDDSGVKQPAVGVVIPPSLLECGLRRNQGCVLAAG